MVAKSRRREISEKARKVRSRYSEAAVRVFALTAREGQADIQPAHSNVDRRAANAIEASRPPGHVALYPAVSRRVVVHS